MTCFRGSLLCFNATGLLVIASDTAGLRVAGIATENVSVALAGQLVSFEFGHQEFLLEVSGAWTGGALGLDACVADDSGVTTALVAVNDIRIGRITQRETINGAVGQWVFIATTNATAAF